MIMLSYHKIEANCSITSVVGLKEAYSKASLTDNRKPIKRFKIQKETIYHRHYAYRSENAFVGSYKGEGRKPDVLVNVMKNLTKTDERCAICHLGS